MRFVQSFILLFLLSIIVVSCEKEMSAENGYLPGSTGTGTAAFALDGAPGACATPIISGTYTVGAALNASNTVKINANVTTIGTYTITTATTNGIKFSASGSFTAVGVQQVLLTGSGTPTVSGPFNFNAGSNGCSFSITVIVPGPPAVFTLAGAPNACTTPTINGTYPAGTALGASNTVQLSVDVTTAGSYNITSPTVNGFSFIGSGSLAPGAQTITLQGSGIPVSTGPAVFTPVTGGCSFTINVTSPGGTSVYTLTGAPGGCTTPVIAGNYLVGATLGGTNTVTIKADVTTAGTYSISTNTVNGMTFSGSGSVAVGTAQSIILTGSGSPTAANTSTFTVGTNGCTFSITAVTPPPAAYTFQGAPGACNPIDVMGTYTTGTALSGTNNTVQVQVNVTTQGSYTITSNTVNGMTFSKSGVFTSSGSQSVTLAGSGTPVATGTNTFTVGAGGCTFGVTVTAPTSPCSGLVDGVFTMTGQFTLNGFSFGASLGSQYQVSIQDGAITLDVFFPGADIPLPGTYSIGSVSMNCLNSDFTNWVATSGSVYVSMDMSGNTVIEFCNVNFSGTPILGGTITSTGAGKMVI